MKKLLLTVVILATCVVSSAKSYEIRLFQPASVGGVELKPGEYKVEFTDSKATLKAGKLSTEAPVKVESTEEKYSSTSVRYQNENGKLRVQEIRLGGTKTKLVFN
ncbi:MAG: hypothetical protein ABIZ80_18695 [Bryobacteraceae bacterium]